MPQIRTKKRKRTLQTAKKSRQQKRPSQAPVKKKTHKNIQAPLIDTFNIKKILIPIDFSEHSKNALKYAIPFARQFNAEIILIYVVEPTVYPADLSFGQFGVPEVENELSKKGEEELSKLIDEEIKSSVKARKIVSVGKPFVEIIHAAREEADLIILSTHGHTGVEHILFGSTAEKVVRKAPCPVLSLRPNEREFVN